MEHGLSDARRRRHLSAGRTLVSGDGRRLYLDGALLPAMVRSAGKDSGEISYLQRLEPMELCDVDSERLDQELEALGAISAEPVPVVTRVVFTDADLRAPRFREGALPRGRSQLRDDAVGNTFARWAGTDPELAAGRHRLAYRRYSQRGPLRRNGGRAGRTGSNPGLAARRLPSAAARSSC